MQATQGYSENHLLGSGIFGSVYRGTLNDGSDVAVKVFDLQNQNAFNSFDVECEVLRNLRHRNLCKVISTCSNQDFKALVLEYMSNGSLQKWLYSDDCLLDILQRINIMIDVACALEYLHYGYSTYIVHCDLKPSNVLLDEDMVAHLSDFGIAKLLGEGESNAHTTTMGTLGYIAPDARRSRSMNRVHAEQIWLNLCTPRKANTMVEPWWVWQGSDGDSGDLVVVFFGKSLKEEEDRCLVL
ncbi:putative LRR receptor-like serine/threonine-protein kinase [Abeliophyllum distichum]|uniref:non-specific serine/threonine protein kinase n=1 Tax=Abeliophyllum distichum TaxID=126358 RepID=A0ABD1QUW0_9LAMI